MKEKRLYKIDQGKMISGVCGGLAEYFDTDPTIVRLIWAAATILSIGTGLLAYIVAAIIIPQRPKDSWEF